MFTFRMIHVTGLRLVPATGWCRGGQRGWEEAGGTAEWGCLGMPHGEDGSLIPGVRLALTGRSQAAKV